jgi:hypothetical protein
MYTSLVSVHRSCTGWRANNSTAHGEAARRGASGSAAPSRPRPRAAPPVRIASEHWLSARRPPRGLLLHVRRGDRPKHPEERVHGLHVRPFRRARSRPFPALPSRTASRGRLGPPPATPAPPPPQHPAVLLKWVAPRQGRRPAPLAPHPAQPATASARAQRKAARTRARGRPGAGGSPKPPGPTPPYRATQPPEVTGPLSARLFASCEPPPPPCSPALKLLTRLLLLRQPRKLRSLVPPYGLHTVY